jgi:hypothetical protein
VNRAIALLRTGDAALVESVEQGEVSLSAAAATAAVDIDADADADATEKKPKKKSKKKALTAEEKWENT